MLNASVWLSKGHFPEGDPSCLWGSFGLKVERFAIPPAGSFLIVYDQDVLPVELWLVELTASIEPHEVEDGWCWFAESTMSDLVAATNPAKLRGIDFSEVASTLLPGGGGWRGRPVELRETDAKDLFDVAGWTREMLQP